MKPSKHLGAPALLLACALLCAAGCDGSSSSGSSMGSGSGAGSSASTSGASTSLVGRWVSDPTLSQLGRIVHTYDFAADGTYAASFEFVDAKLPAMTSKGTYDTKLRALLAEGKSPGAGMSYAFDGDVLVLTEGNKDSYRLKRR